jgi:flagellar motility protein MotE (MotC chaperone)
MKRTFFSSRYLLPLMIFLGVLIMGLSIGDIWQAASSGKMFTSAAMAQSKDTPKPDPAKNPPPIDSKASDAAGAAKDGVPPIATPSLNDSAATMAPPPDDSEKSPAEIEVLNQLSQRREQLEKRARDLDTRESLLKIAESRVDQKIKEMETLRAQLQAMVNQVGEAQSVQADNLVKIYETMKPEEAARIFETLDMPVLLSVIQRMKPKSTAPIMAKMAPEKAKDVTVALTRQDQLPKIK